MDGWITCWWSMNESMCIGLLIGMASGWMMMNNNHHQQQPIQPWTCHYCDMLCVCIGIYIEFDHWMDSYTSDDNILMLGFNIQWSFRLEQQLLDEWRKDFKDFKDLIWKTREKYFCWGRSKSSFLFRGAYFS